MSNNNHCKPEVLIINGAIVNWSFYVGNDRVYASEVVSVSPVIDKNCKYNLTVKDNINKFSNVSVGLQFFRTFKPKVGDYLLFSELYGTLICLAADVFNLSYKKDI